MFWQEMSRPATTSSLKRKKTEPKSLSDALGDTDQRVLEVIKDTKDMGIWTRDIKNKMKLTDHVVTKSLKSLLAKKLIKEVVNIQNKARKHYMAVEFEPSKEVSGGAWYVEGKLDTKFINDLKNICMTIIGRQKVATFEGIYDLLKKVTKVECTEQHVGEILNSMLLENEIIEVKSTGWGEYHSFPVGTLCYRLGSGAGLGKGARVGAMASIPCGMCPRINQCTPDGVISPATCEYYKKWLSDLNF
ncbi:OLC1v1030922C2 [Oldenlandia corymbosa var. corymbosa]|uniref:DNA-directed RNA polymerase III subunit RPC6 n=1 Tax=Oldenlandia corymbosa var. corymbosa TaxID=529605 RepID=A0AAV1CHZ7_OLDCO|nr:OLC1v1030922C2 [Oldenlandia corymbosa var. corymbosa]